MAEIQTVQVGSKVSTRIRGRVFRFAPKAKRRSEPRSQERRVVCVLDVHAGRLLEHWSLSQACHGPTCQHKHLTRETVGELVRDGVLRYVPDSGKNVAVYTQGRTWKGVPSGPERMKVMQLV